MMRLPSLLRNSRFISGLLVVFFTLSLLAPLSAVRAKPALAYSSGKISEYQRDVFEPAVFGTNEMNLESFTWESFKALLSSLSVAINGPINPAYRDQLSLVPSGAVGTVAALIPLLYAAPPVSGVEYMAHLGETVGLATPAYAQGIGFTSLQPVLPVWEAFRNIAYVLFVIVFVLIGLAIMFRVRLNPQTVIGIQNAIPRLVVALLLVTFSYAIAGFLYDLIFVSMYLLIAAFRAGGLINPTDGGAGIVDWLLTSGSVIHLGLAVLFISLGNIIGVIDHLLVGMLFPDVPVISFILNYTLGPIVAFIISLLVGIVLLIVLLRLFWLLLSSYVQIVLAVIFAPFQLLLGALPAVETFGFSAWFRGLVSNIIVFPATYGLIILAHILMGPTVLGIPGGPGISVGNIFGLSQDIGYGSSGAGVLPPGLGAGSTTPAGAQALIGIGILLMLPGILNRMKEAIRGRVPPMEFFGRTERAAALGGAAWGAQRFYYGKEARIPGRLRAPVTGAVRVLETVGLFKGAPTAGTGRRGR